MESSVAQFNVSKTTGKILKNFAGISNSILLKEGAKQRTIASTKSILADAVLPEAWPRETGIYDLNTFLSTLSLFDKPAIEFADDAFIISQGKSRVKYRYSDPSTILTPPKKVLPTENPAVTFKLTDAALSQLNKTCAVLQLPAITIVVRDGEVGVRASDVKNPTSHAFEYIVPVEDISLDDKSFSANVEFPNEYLGKLLDGSYQVSLSSWPYGYFKHETEPIAYYIVANAPQE